MTFPATNLLYLLRMAVILGIDPGSRYMGYALVQVNGRNLCTLHTGVLNLSKYPSHYDRLSRIAETVEQLIREFHPQALAIETPFYGRSVASMMKLGRAQGAAVLTALRLQVPVFEYAPRRVKQAVTGRGAASKEQVQAILRQLHLLQSSEARLDASDALAVAVCHAFSCSSRQFQTETKSAPFVPSSSSRRRSKGWEEFIRQNPDRLR